MPSRWEFRCFSVSKDPDYPHELEDAVAVDAQRGVAALADGAAESLFAGEWAELLTAAAIRSPLPPEGSYRDWLSMRRQEWRRRITGYSLSWPQELKLGRIGGAYSTLLAIVLDHTVRDEDQAVLRVWAVGDTCLFQIHRDGISSFPLCNPDEFTQSPPVLGSMEDADCPAPKTKEAVCRRGDRLLMATDSLSEWLLRQTLGGIEAIWSSWWTATPEQWAAEIESLRRSRALRVDDTTAILLRLQ